MQTLFILYFFLIGSILGSFFNVVGLRVPKKELFLKHNRSFCPNCYHTLRWYELIPILSYLLQHGKCRKCKERISLLYPVMEGSMGLVFTFSYWFLGWQMNLLFALLLFSLFHIVLVSDYCYMVIPNKVLLIFFFIFLPFVLFHPYESLQSSIIGGIAGYVITAIIILVSRGGMGGGDMKLFALIGFVLGWKSLLLTFFLSSLIGTIVSLLLISLNVISRKDPFPFGPFIVISASFVFFSGKMVIDWYAKFFYFGVI